MTSAEPNDRSLTVLLHVLGWSAHIDGTPHGDHPVDGRPMWSDEIIEGRLRTKLREINAGPDGEAWLDDARIDRIVTELRRTEPNLVEANKQVTELLLQGIRVEGLPDWDQGRTQVAALIDWGHPENNDLLLVTDFRLDRPYDGGARFVVLDAVLFVNGIPFAVIEGVRPDREPTVGEAIADLRAYTGTRLAGERQDVSAFFRFVHVVDAVVLDAAYEREVGGTSRERQEAQQRWVTSRQALESMDFIGSKARDMLRHWVSSVLPNGFKAQMVAVSRLAAVRYRDALLATRDELVRELEEFARLGPDAAAQHSDIDFLRTALPFLPLLRMIDFVPVISAGVTKDEQGQFRHDPPEWRRWTDETNQRDHIDRLKQRLPAPETLAADHPLPTPGAPWANYPAYTTSPHPVHAGAEYDPWHGASPDDNFDRFTQPANNVWPDPAGGPGGAGPAPVAFLIVMSMLLTGFDAPIEQVLYLDRPIRDVELLQAIARTNRPARHKEVGLVVDYAGISRHLDEALSAYDEADLDGYKEFLIAEELPRLRDRRELVHQFLAEHGIGVIAALADGAVRTRLVTLLADPELRTDFDGLVGDFLATLDVVLPRPEALEYEDDAARLGLVQLLLRRTYRDSRSGGLDPYQYGAKVRRLLDRHIRHIRISGITQRIPPVDVSAPDFLDRVGQVEDTRLRAMHMEHALRRHISQQRPGNPAYYESLSERLERVLQQLRDDPEWLARALDELIRQERQEASQGGVDGLDLRTELPIYRLLERRLGKAITESSGVPVTRAIVEIIVEDACAPHFLDSSSLQNTLRRRLLNHLIRNVNCDRDIATPLAEEIVAVVRARWTNFCP